MPAASPPATSHMSRIVAEPGSIVRQGQLIGYVGSSGLSTGPHLHYEVYRGGAAVNPLLGALRQPLDVEGAELEAFRARLRTYLRRDEGLIAVGHRPLTLRMARCLGHARSDDRPCIRSATSPGTEAAQLRQPVTCFRPSR